MNHEGQEVSSSGNDFVQTAGTRLTQMVLEDGEAAAVLSD